MKRISTSTVWLAIFLVMAVSAKANTNPPTEKRTKIQAAILLDVSNSMDGLIEQAKAQLWNMVSVMGKAKCEGVTPDIEIALYEYGRTSNDTKNGYVKQISGFTTDLDQLSKSLFSLTTYGGAEYCGYVIHNAINELNWDADTGSYKVIFIAGNEDFLQGNISFTQACSEAATKGVVVNTIYCGDRMQGIQEHWNLGAECGKGSFTNINSDAKIEDAPTPYDSLLLSLNDKLNYTYVGYGVTGAAKMQEQASVDKMNYTMSKSAAVKRATVKAKKEIYRNSSWDLVEAAESDSTLIARIDMKTLPDSLQKKSRLEIAKIIQEKQKNRGTIQQDIEKTGKKREEWLANERKKNANSPKANTLETEVEKIIRNQASKHRMIIE